MAKSHTGLSSCSGRRAGRLPLILASPHSGSDYPADFVAASRLDPLALRRSEDSFVDELFGAAPSLGAPLLSARFPRAYLDVNREAYELDPAMFADALPDFVNAGFAAGADGSRHDRPHRRQRRGDLCRQTALYRRTAADRRPLSSVSPGAPPAGRRGRGVVWRLSAGRLPFDAVRRRLDLRPGGADIVLGDCHGTACAPAILEAARRFFADARICRRDQYALRRRVYHRTLRRPAPPPTRLAGRDQPRALHGRAQFPAKAALCSACGGDERTYPPAERGRAGVPCRHLRSNIRDDRCN